MKQKDMYTLEELYDNLKISLSKLSKIADINEGTLIRIRKGKYSVRKTTVNKLLDAFSEVYGLEFSLDNVTGITLEDKKALHSQKDIAEKVIGPHVPAPVKPTKVVTDKAPKRAYNKQHDTGGSKGTGGLPVGSILASEFAKLHDVPRPTFIDHMLIGKGPGTVPGEETHPMLPVKERVDYSERPNGRKRKKADGTVIDEMEKYLTSDQQHQALEFWKKHDVGFEVCNRIDCWCHTVKGE